MSMPRSAWRRTTSLTAPGRTALNSLSGPSLNNRATASGRGKVPACETRIRSVLRRIGVSLYCGCRTKNAAEIKHMSSRTQAAEAYIKALRTGEPSATQAAGQYLADDVVLATAQGEVSGRTEVLKRI